MNHFGLAWVASIAMMSGVAQAAPSFSVSPATPDGPVASDLDLAWQGLASAAPASLGVTITEFDFDGTPGVDVTELETSDGTMASLLGWIFYGWYEGGGGPIYGVVSGGVLEGYGSQIQITFDTPVYGLGAWNFDDGMAVENGLSMTVVEADGTMTTAPLLDTGNGLGHRIEGFVGAVSDIGITEVYFDNIDLGGGGPPECCLILDHLQIASAATPSDDDGDGVVWGVDLCPDSAPGAVVGPDGCDAPELVVGGSCPGVTTIELTGMTPGGQVALFNAGALGATPTWAGPCAGTMLDVAATSPPMVIPDSDGDGAFSFSPFLSPALCGRYIQAMDVTTCTTTAAFPL